MKFSAQEEYGLRCLLQIGRAGIEKSVTISEISRAEGITTHNVAKILRILRRGGFIESVRGHTGGYTIARPPEQTNVGEVLALLGGRLFDPNFCKRYAGIAPLCMHSIDCSIRSLWQNIQSVVDYVLSQTTLKDLLGNEESQNFRLNLLTTSLQGGSSPQEPSSCAIHLLKLTSNKISSS
ncbi:MAG: Rrf2 family transcriptional regulator [Planctomycetota bacterium]